MKFYEGYNHENLFAKLYEDMLYANTKSEIHEISHGEKGFYKAYDNGELTFSEMYLLSELLNMLLVNGPFKERRIWTEEDLKK